MWVIFRNDSFIFSLLRINNVQIPRESLQIDFFLEYIAIRKNFLKILSDSIFCY